jgi:hypothetical protein
MVIFPRTSKKLQKENDSIQKSKPQNTKQKLAPSISKQ